MPETIAQTCDEPNCNREIAYHAGPDIETINIDPFCLCASCGKHANGVLVPVKQ